MEISPQTHLSPFTPFVCFLLAAQQASASPSTFHHLGKDQAAQKQRVKPPVNISCTSRCTRCQIPSLVIQSANTELQCRDTCHFTSAPAACNHSRPNTPAQLSFFQSDIIWSLKGVGHSESQRSNFENFFMDYTTVQLNSWITRCAFIFCNSSSAATT